MYTSLPSTLPYLLHHNAHSRPTTEEGNVDGWWVLRPKYTATHHPFQFPMKETTTSKKTRTESRNPCQIRDEGDKMLCPLEDLAGDINKEIIGWNGEREENYEYQTRVG